MKDGAEYICTKSFELCEWGFCDVHEGGAPQPEKKLGLSVVEGSIWKVRVIDDYLAALFNTTWMDGFRIHVTTYDGFFDAHFCRIQPCHGCTHSNPELSSLAGYTWCSLVDGEQRDDYGECQEWEMEI